MANEKPKIKIFDPAADITAKFDYYIKIVIGILVVAVLTMLFMLGGILLDAWHFNSAVYKEYSEKMDILDTLQTSNERFLEETKQNQEIIIQQQKQIQEMLNKK